MGGGVGWTRARFTPLSLKRLDERRLLAADVGTCAAMGMDVEGEIAAEDVPSQKAHLARLIDRFSQPLLG